VIVGKARATRKDDRVVVVAMAEGTADGEVASRASSVRESVTAFGGGRSSLRRRPGASDRCEHGCGEKQPPASHVNHLRDASMDRTWRFTTTAARGTTRHLLLQRDADRTTGV
jgi:hypothetical protein